MTKRCEALSIYEGRYIPTCHVFVATRMIVSLACCSVGDTDDLVDCCELVKQGHSLLGPFWSRRYVSESFAGIFQPWASRALSRLTIHQCFVLSEL